MLLNSLLEGSGEFNMIKKFLPNTTKCLTKEKTVIEHVLALHVRLHSHQVGNSFPKIL